MRPWLNTTDDVGSFAKPQSAPIASMRPWLNTTDDAATGLAIDEHAEASMRPWLNTTDDWRFRLICAVSITRFNEAVAQHHGRLLYDAGHGALLTELQ